MENLKEVTNTIGDRLEIKDQLTYEKIMQSKHELKKLEYERVTFTDIQRQQIKEYCETLGYTVTFNKENKAAKISAEYDINIESPAGVFSKRVNRFGFICHKAKGTLEYGFFKKTNWSYKYDFDNELKMYLFLRSMFSGKLLKAISQQNLRIICGLPELELNTN